MRKREGGFTLIELLIVIAIIGIIAAIAIPNLLNAMDRGKQKRTMADLRSIGTAIESYQIDNSHYPVAVVMAGATGLENFIEPIYIRSAPLADGWTRSFQVASQFDSYTVCSGGKVPGTCTADSSGPTQSFNASIVFANGGFVQWPEGSQQ